MLCEANACQRTGRFLDLIEQLSSLCLTLTDRTFASRIAIQPTGVQKSYMVIWGEPIEIVVGTRIEVYALYDRR